MTTFDTIQATVAGEIGHVCVECNECETKKTFTGDNAVTETKSYIEEHNYKRDHDDFDVSVGIVTTIEEIDVEHVVDL